MNDDYQDIEELTVKNTSNDEKVAYSKNYAYSKRKKQAIKFLCVTRFGKSQRHDIAFLTTDTKFYHVSLRFKQDIHHISYIHRQKIWDVFKNFDFNKNTEIVIQDTVDDFCPLMVYFDIIKPYVKFWLVKTALTKMVRRICYKHPTISKRLTKGTAKLTDKNVTMFLSKAWHKLIEFEACPWITKRIDDRLKLFNDSKYHIRVRICLYYMIIRRYLMNIHNKSSAKKQSLKQQNIN